MIITAPHGGNRKPNDIPDRPTYGCKTNDGQQCISRHSKHCNTMSGKKCKINKKKDSKTIEIANNIYNYIKKTTGIAPHLIINKLHRSKMDANRMPDEATFGNANALSVWAEYHLSILNAKRLINGPGIIFDIHGKVKTEIDLGYLIDRNTLISKKAVPDPKKSSIRALFDRSHMVRFQDLISGKESFGSMIKNKHYTGTTYKVIPSPSYPRPKKEKYFPGGFTIKAHGSRYVGCIDAIQIESPESLRSLKSQALKKYSEDLAEAMIKFTKKYYSNELYNECP